MGEFFVWAYQDSNLGPRHYLPDIALRSQDGRVSLSLTNSKNIL